MTLPDNHTDVTRHLLAQPNAEKHMHRINRGDHPGLSKRSDFDPGGVEVPACPERERVDPGEINDQRRKPSFDVTCISSEGATAPGDMYAAHAGNHLSEPVPEKL
jgi:hypothetical protein